MEPRGGLAMSAVQELILALRSEADVSEKGLDCMDDEDLANETRVQIGMLRDAANEIERLNAWYLSTLPLIAALAVYGEEASLDALVAKARELNEVKP